MPQWKSPTSRSLNSAPAEPGQHRVAEVAVQRRHGARADAALEPVAHHHVVALAELLDERARLDRSYESSESAMITYLPRAASMPAISAPP